MSKGMAIRDGVAVDGVATRNVYEFLEVGDTPSISKTVFVDQTFDINFIIMPDDLRCIYG